jgi:hypothetical protein
MVQTRNQLRNQKKVTFSETEFNELNHNISILNLKHNDIKEKVNYMDIKINHIVNEVHNIQNIQKNGYSLNQLYLIFILIGLLILFFNYNKIYEEIVEITNMLTNNISYNYDDFSMYHTYVFNSTFSEEWFDKLVDSSFTCE